MQEQINKITQFPINLSLNRYAQCSIDTIREIKVSELVTELYIINLGIVQEIAEEDDLVAVHILRKNEKHVLRYHKSAKLFVM